MERAVAIAKGQAAPPLAAIHTPNSVVSAETELTRTRLQTDQWLAFLGGQGIRPKLKVSTPGDADEREADAVADRVMRMAEPGPMGRSDAQVHRQCAACTDDDRNVIARKADGTSAISASQSISALSNLGTGAPLPAQERAFFEPRFGTDLSSVRIHSDAAGDRAARSIQARAFTKGRDIGFASGEFQPGTSKGRHLIAHELAHVMQQDIGVVRRLSAADCSTDCAGSDGQDTATGKYTLTIMADKEGPFLLIPATSNVGHSWLKLQDDKGNYWTYGFWPESGFDPSNSTADVEGCVHHPDHAHDDHITSSQTFELDATQFSSARSYAEKICSSKPKYNLFNYNCTSFVRYTAEAAGQSTFGGFGLIWDSPNALDGWMRVHALEIGANFTAGSSAPSQQSQGNFGFELAYRHQAFSMLGNKLRLYGVGQGELGSAIKTISGGIGVSVDPQYIWLPSLYLEGMGALGDMNVGAEKFGAGASVGYGLNYKIDAFGSVGIEHNFLKDFVNDDPALGRLLIKAKINLW